MLEEERGPCRLMTQRTADIFVFFVVARSSLSYSPGCLEDNGSTFEGWAGLVGCQE